MVAERSARSGTIEIAYEWSDDEADASAKPPTPHAVPDSAEFVTPPRSTDNPKASGPAASDDQVDRSLVTGSPPAGAPDVGSTEVETEVAVSSSQMFPKRQRCAVPLDALKTLTPDKRQVAQGTVDVLPVKRRSSTASSQPSPCRAPAAASQPTAKRRWSISLNQPSPNRATSARLASASQPTLSSTSWATGGRPTGGSGQSAIDAIDPTTRAGDTIQKSPEPQTAQNQIGPRAAGQGEATVATPVVSIPQASGGQSTQAQVTVRIQALPQPAAARVVSAVSQRTTTDVATVHREPRAEAVRNAGGRQGRVQPDIEAVPDWMREQYTFVATEDLISAKPRSHKRKVPEGTTTTTTTGRKRGQPRSNAAAGAGQTRLARWMQAEPATTSAGVAGRKRRRTGLAAIDEATDGEADEPEIVSVRRGPAQTIVDIDQEAAQPEVAAPTRAAKVANGADRMTRRRATEQSQSEIESTPRAAGLPARHPSADEMSVTEQESRAPASVGSYTLTCHASWPRQPSSASNLTPLGASSSPLPTRLSQVEMIGTPPSARLEMGCEVPLSELALADAHELTQRLVSISSDWRSVQLLYDRLRATLKSLDVDSPSKEARIGAYKMHADRSARWFNLVAANLRAALQTRASSLVYLDFPEVSPPRSPFASQEPRWR